MAHNCSAQFVRHVKMANRTASNMAGLRNARAEETARKTAAVRRVLDEMIANGESIIFSEVERRAGVSHWFLYHGLGIRQMIIEARQRSVTDVGPELRSIATDMARAPIDLKALALRVDDAVTRIARLADEVHGLVELVRLANHSSRLLCSFREARDILGVSEGELAQLVDTGHLVAIVMEGKHFVTDRSLADYRSRPRSGRPR